ncbi:unnamed protein product [Camellia sinensis]
MKPINESCEFSKSGLSDGSQKLSTKAAMETHLRRSNEGGGGGGGNDGLTRDFLGLRTISHRGFPNMAGLDHMNSPSSSYD